MGVVGIVVNPSSGKDIRRFATHASVFVNREKEAIVRRCISGMLGVHQPDIRYFSDSYGIVESALVELGVEGEPLPFANKGNASDSTRAAELLRGCDVVISLGGDGTNRAIAKGWLNCPLIALSTGTNNAFPVMAEATSAGMAAALIAAGSISIERVSVATKAIHVSIEDEDPDLALIDVVGTTERFIGARALLDPSNWRFALTTVANPAGLGVSGVAGSIRSVSQDDDEGTAMFFCPSKTPRTTVVAAIAPGEVRQVEVAATHLQSLGSPLKVEGPLLLAFDGERDRTIKAGQRASLVIHRDGPRLINIDQTMQLAARERMLATNHVKEVINDAY